MVVENQPGASGSIGTKNALEAGKDGYTWTAGAAQDLGTYVVLGMLDTIDQATGTSTSTSRTSPSSASMPMRRGKTSASSWTP